jgi:hypothetical protein
MRHRYLCPALSIRDDMSGDRAGVRREARLATEGTTEWPLRPLSEEQHGACTDHADTEQQRPPRRTTKDHGGDHGQANEEER